MPFPAHLLTAWCENAGGGHTGAAGGIISSVPAPGVGAGVLSHQLHTFVVHGSG